MYEHASEPLISRRDFTMRMLRHGAGALALLGGSLMIGIVGYAALDNMKPVDAFLNASMILGGMGPVDPLTNNTAKIFAGVYALYSGAVFLVAVGVVFAPVLHRIFHKLHLESGQPGPSGSVEG
jgi:hypothetical protein